MKTEMIMVERDQARQALDEREQRFSRLLAAITDYIYTVQLHDGRAQTTTHGPGCEGVTGYTSVEFSADPYLWFRLVHEDDRKLVLAQTERIMGANGRPQPLEHRIVHKDGSIRWIRNTCIPHFDHQGHLESYDGLIKDITVEKRLEEARREVEERLSLIIEGSTDGVWDWNVVTGQTFFSHRWKSMLGYEDHELPNHFETWKGLIHPDDKERALQTLEQAFVDQASSFMLEHRLHHKDGSYRWILARGVVRRDQQARPIRMAGTHVDITKQKLAARHLELINHRLRRKSDALLRLARQHKSALVALESSTERLTQAAKMEFVSILAAGIAHEVRNPLQTLLGGVNYLRGRFEPPDATLRIVLDDMQGAVRRADKIISAMEPPNGGGGCRREDLKLIIKEALQMVQRDLVSCGVRVCCNMEHDSLTVCADADRLCEVFLNLILNALHAMPDGGVLTVRGYTVRQGSHSDRDAIREMAVSSDVVVAEVQDTGPGINPEDLSHIFEPFWSRRSRGKGSGLGLPVAKRIMELHHGVIDVTNAPAGGVCVAVILPAASGAKEWCDSERRHE